MVSAMKNTRIATNSLVQNRPFIAEPVATYPLMKHGLIIIFNLCIALALALWTPRAMAELLPDFEQLVNEQGKAVVKVTVTGRTAPADFNSQLPNLPPQFRYFFEEMPQQRPQPTSGFGSGFIISEDGYIVTNAHVVDNAKEVRIQLTDRKEYIADVVGSDERTDIAVLKVDANDLPYVTLGDSDSVNVGQWVLAIGSPFGFEYTATQGIISAVSRSLPNENYVPFIQTDAAVNPGNSGGPLFDKDGRVIGVNSQIYSRSGGYMGLSFAIPINVAMSVADQIKENGFVSRGWLGVTIQNVDQSLADSFGLDRPTGALVSQVTDGSPAEKAGIKTGDVILTFNDTNITRSAELPPLVGLVPVGEKAEISLKRQNKTITLEVTIAELDDGAGSVKTSGRKNTQSDLGVVVSELSPSQKESTDGLGVLIQQVQPDGSAAASGLRSGDILLSFNQIDIKSVSQLRELVREAPRDKPVPALVQRDGQPLFSALTLQ